MCPFVLRAAFLVAPTDKDRFTTPGLVCVCVCVTEAVPCETRRAGMFRFYETITIMNDLPDRSPGFFFSSGASMTSGCVLAAHQTLA
ncbi:hypothetical protein V8C26DRAFT_25570 [Trichoderma gracile]